MERWASWVGVRRLASRTVAAAAIATRALLVAALVNQAATAVEAKVLSLSVVGALTVVGAVVGIVTWAIVKACHRLDAPGQVGRAVEVAIPYVAWVGVLASGLSTRSTEVVLLLIAPTFEASLRAVTSAGAWERLGLLCGPILALGAGFSSSRNGNEMALTAAAALAGSAVGAIQRARKDARVLHGSERES